MILSASHQHDLWSIGMRGLATLISVLLFWGTTAPSIFHEHDIYTLSQYSGLSAALVLIGCFRSSYVNLLTTHKVSPKRRKLGFVIFWFCGSLSLTLVWKLPYWTIPAISRAPKTTDGLYWKIVWWSFTLHDSWYENLTKLVIAFEIWWFLGNLIGAFGLYKYFTGIRSSLAVPQRRQHFQESLLFFAICGALQCYNATVYLFMSYYLDNFDNVPRNLCSQIIFWAMNSFWALASAIATIFSCQILLDNTRILSYHLESMSSL